MPRGRGGGEELLDVGQEAKVEHLIRFIEHHGACPAKVEVTLVHQVDEAAGSADHHVDAIAECFDLGLVRPPAVDLKNASGSLLRRGVKVAGNLHGKFAGGSHNECLGLAGTFAELVIAGLTWGDRVMQQRDTEAEGLSGAGLGLADDVVPLQGHGQGQRLDRKRG